MMAHNPLPLMFPCARAPESGLVSPMILIEWERHSLPLLYPTITVGRSARAMISRLFCLSLPPLWLPCMHRSVRLPASSSPPHESNRVILDVAASLACRGGRLRGKQTRAGLNGISVCPLATTTVVVLVMLQRAGIGRDRIATKTSSHNATRKKEEEGRAGSRAGKGCWWE